MQESYVRLFGIVFMLGAGYTLLHNGHVRVDIFYRLASERHKAWVFAPSVGSPLCGLDIFKAAVLPSSCPALAGDEGRPDNMVGRVLKVLLPPMVLIVLVLGLILGGAATPTESAAVGAIGAMLAVMALMFVMGFFLISSRSFSSWYPPSPFLLGMELHLVWFGVMIAINLQTSFLTPPFGFALFNLQASHRPS